MTKLKKKAFSMLSKYVRYKERGVCFTCGVKDDPKKMDAGHFVSRRHLATFFDERNVHCQCKRCNRWLRGNEAAYAVALVSKYGPGVVEDLYAQSQKITQLAGSELLMIYEVYKRKFNELMDKQEG